MNTLYAVSVASDRAVWNPGDMLGTWKDFNSLLVWKASGHKHVLYWLCSLSIDEAAVSKRPQVYSFYTNSVEKMY